MGNASAGRGRFVRSAAAASVLFLGAMPAQADHIKNDTAVYSGLDKITGRIVSFKAKMGETVQFGSLQVTSRACFTRPAKEAPQTDSFLEIDEVSSTKDFKRIFSGWMFAASPGLHGLEHPIYDIWLTGCENPGDTIVDAPQVASDDTVASAPAGSDATPGAPAADGTVAPAPPPVAEALKPKPKRAARPAPRPEAPAVAERREPSQSYFPASQYPADVSPPDPAGHGSGR